MTCPKCRQATEPGWRVCAFCGTALTYTKHESTKNRKATAQEKKPVASVNCPTCRGTGTVRCGACRNGLTEYGDRCGGCNGTGREPCRGLGCRGSGKIPGWGTLTCSICRGTGRRPCISCVGKGYDYFGKPCFYCASTGQGDCMSCAGTGKDAWPNKDGSPASLKGLWPR